MLQSLDIEVKKIRHIGMFFLFVCSILVLSSESVSATETLSIEYPDGNQVKIISRAEAIKAAKRKESGKVVSIKLVKKGARQQYRVRILKTSSGQNKVKTVLVDAVTGSVIKVKG